MTRVSLKLPITVINSLFEGIMVVVAVTVVIRDVGALVTVMLGQFTTSMMVFEVI